MRVTYAYRRLIRVGMLLFLPVLLLTGCISSSIRFTSASGNGTSQRTKVPADWDYRSTYSISCGRLGQVAHGYLGIRYRYGGMNRNGTDCSGLVCMIYNDVAKAKLPHSSRRQRQLGRVVALRNAKCGDLVFFRGGIFGAITHVGIYLDNNRFIHASTKRGVIYSRLEEEYYKKRFAEVRRIFK